MKTIAVILSVGLLLNSNLTSTNDIRRLYNFGASRDITVVQKEYEDVKQKYDTETTKQSESVAISLHNEEVNRKKEEVENAISEIKREEYKFYQVVKDYEVTLLKKLVGKVVDNKVNTLKESIKDLSYVESKVFNNPNLEELSDRFERLRIEYRSISEERTIGQIRVKPPLDTDRWVKTSPFGFRDDPIATNVRRMHNGIDYAAASGTLVYAIWGGTISYSGYNGNGGLTVEIAHGNGLMTRYLHLMTPLVQQGDFVEQGDYIGMVGSTGYSTGPHLHFELRIDGQAVDPIKIIKED